ncbi:MAG: alanyl-tRNA editing protein [Gammaproteobacteria bacterium]|nr:alanyl-tRNA editing protein [Gammaproteobacteria bacterium]
MKTEELFRADGYLRYCNAHVVSVGEGSICVDRTVFYPEGGGQPGDKGVLIREGGNGEQLKIIDTKKDRDTGAHLHFVDQGELPAIGEEVVLQIDWERRYRLMRMHSCMHLLCAVVPAGVTGGSVRDDGSARLDFDLPLPPDKLEIETEVNRLISENHPMSLEWISDEELANQPELVRTMSVKPPTGGGRIRLVRFGEIDLQPCGGTHVAATGEIGEIRVKKIEKKGKNNRRITIELA